MSTLLQCYLTEHEVYKAVVCHTSSSLEGLMTSNCNWPLEISIQRIMKSLFAIAALAASASGHAIMQKLSVNGQDQGQLKGVRAPSSDYPLYSPNDSNFACNTGIVYKDSNVISMPAGAKVGAWWGHVIG